MLKRTLLGSTMLLVLSVAASAAVLSCDSVTTLSALIAAGSGGCVHQDKLFNNFAYTGEQVGNILVTHEFTASQTGTTDVHGWLFSLPGNWTTSFNLQYDISIVAGFPFQRIYAVTDQMNSGITPNNTSITDLETVTPSGSYSLTVNGSAPSAETLQRLFSPLATNVHTNSTFTPGTGGQLASYEQDYFETAIPEPATSMLLGSGLLALGYMLRRKRA